MFPGELGEGGGILPPVFRKSFELLEYCGDPRLLEEHHGIINILVKISVEDPDVHEPGIVVEEHPAQIVEPQRREYMRIS